MYKLLSQNFLFRNHAKQDHVFCYEEIPKALGVGGAPKKNRVTFRRNFVLKTMPNELQ